ncbi:MAG: PocR ligand-binding domain-containing protein [Opitutaceae bacterium]|nr:PocR ligand-binding domain-containing protein [Opitutaceae bacterium]
MNASTTSAAKPDISDLVVSVTNECGERLRYPVKVANAAPITQGMVTRLRQSEIFRDYQRAFQTTTGLPLAIRATGSFQPPLYGSKQANPFCVLMATRNKSCAACLQLQQEIEDGATAEPATMECFAGLSDSAVPIRVGENVIGHLQTGQVLLREPSKARFRHTVRQLDEWETAIDLRRLEAVYFQTRVIARRRYESVLRLLDIFALQLSALSNQLVVKEVAAELPAVATARRFIAEHLGEKLSLSRVAEAANMSAVYFCKRFRRETGLNFSDYVRRMRIEEVKQLLLNPHTRVSEAAFAAGFQSLSQFNRDFRLVAGETPSTFRERLHGLPGSAAAIRGAPRAA